MSAARLVAASAARSAGPLAEKSVDLRVDVWAGATAVT
jgi:hypothetical protein